MYTVRFHYADVKPLYLKNKTRVKNAIIELFKKEDKVLNQISYVFCSDKYLLEINKSYLKHNYFTDIITFNLGNSEIIEGEVYISVERVKENANTFKVLFNNELLRVIIHGGLHLCGYKDKKKREKIIMREKEEYYLLRLK